jgi:cysteine synthase A
MTKRSGQSAKSIVVILSDTTERFLSSALFESVFDEKDLPA